MWPRPLSQRARWLPKRWKESSSWHFDGKERKGKHVYRSLVHKIEERSDWRDFSVQLPCLPTATMAMAPYHGRAVLATRPTSPSHNSVRIAFMKLQNRFLCRGMIPLSIYTKKWKMIIITLGNYYFGLYLRWMSSALCLVSSWRVTNSKKTTIGMSQLLEILFEFNIWEIHALPTQWSWAVL